jgi:hypothetical protein
MLSPQDYESFFIGLTGNSVKQYQSILMEIESEIQNESIEEFEKIQQKI